MSDVEVIKENPQTESLELVVTEKAVGYLETNIEALETYVKQKLEEYKPENYMGDADLAKKDRAELNKARDKISRARKELIAELMKPYNDFETRCKALEKMIDSASGALDEIVKTKEGEEKEQKRKKIELMWLTKNFDLFPLDKIFNPKWLNKTCKDKEILEEMDSVIERTYHDLKLIDKFADDSETLKAHYLINLDISETLDYGEELQKQREVAKREAEGRAEREHQEKINQQKEEVEEQQRQEETGVSSLVDEAMASMGYDVPKPQRKEYVITVKCFDGELQGLKVAMNNLGIEYSVQELTF